MTRRTFSEALQPYAIALMGVVGSETIV